jgi:hypothetical protein
MSEKIFQETGNDDAFMSIVRPLIEIMKGCLEKITWLEKLFDKLEFAKREGFYAIVLPIEENERVPIVKFSNKIRIEEPKLSDHNCIICLENIHSDEIKTCSNSCNGKLCPTCYISWFSENKNCPHCRN